MRSTDNSKRRTISAIGNSAPSVSKLNMKSTSLIAARTRAGFVLSARAFASALDVSDKIP
jgi:hypothetical protein